MSKSIHINGNRDEAFLSKGAIERFKSDLRSGNPKQQKEYLHQHWSYEITKQDEKSITVNLNHVIPMFQVDSKRQRQKLHERISLLKKTRQPIVNAKMREKVPSEITEAYVTAKRSLPIQFTLMDPYDVITNPEKYRNDIRNIVQSTTHLSNPYTKYYNLLHNHLVTESAVQHAESQPVLLQPSENTEIQKDEPKIVVVE